jgi:hypothetical protein
LHGDQPGDSLPDDGMVVDAQDANAIGIAAHDVLSSRSFPAASEPLAADDAV